MPPRKERLLKIYTDISLGARVSGLGIYAEGFDGSEPLRHKSCLPPGLSPVEAELSAMVLAVEILGEARKSTLKKTDGVRFYTDCGSAIRAIFQMNRVRSKVSKALVKSFVRTSEQFTQETGIPVLVQPIDSALNPAHGVAREARKEWIDRLSGRVENFSR